MTGPPRSVPGNFLGMEYMAPIHNAARNGSVNSVKTFLNSGTNVNTRGNGGETPLIGAAFEGHLELVKLLLARGANINAQSTDDGYTALMAASLYGYLPIVKLLINRGANKSLKSKDGETALFLAKGEGRNNIAEELMKTKTNSVYNKKFMTAVKLGTKLTTLLSTVRSKRKIFPGNKRLVTNEQLKRRLGTIFAKRNINAEANNLAKKYSTIMLKQTPNSRRTNLKLSKSPGGRIHSSGKLLTGLKREELVKLANKYGIPHSGKTKPQLINAIWG